MCIRDRQFGASVFHTVVRWHKLGEVVNECTIHNNIVLAIFLPKIIKIGENLTKLAYAKNNFDCFLRHGVYGSSSTTARLLRITTNYSSCRKNCQSDCWACQCTVCNVFHRADLPLSADKSYGIPKKHLRVNTRGKKKVSIQITKW